MLKEFFIKKMLKSKGVSGEQVDMLMEIIKKNPALFQQIAEEIQKKLEKGGDQMAVAEEVMKKYQSELQKIMGK